MALTTRHAIGLTVGVVMLSIGIFLLARPLFVPGAVTSSRWLDVAFAAFFLVRGGMNVRLALRARGDPERR
jgi:hypothetical protein